MRVLSALLLAGAGSLALAGAVSAQGLPVHRMNVQLPDGTVEQIAYAGPVAPRVTVLPATALDSAVAPFWPAGSDPMLAQFEEVSAAMDQEADAMLRQAAALMAQPALGPGFVAGAPAGAWQVDTAALPRGARDYSFVATIGPDGAVCSQSVTITAEGPGQKPRVVRHESGNCSGAGLGIGTPAGIGLPNAVPPAAAPAHVMSVKATPPAARPYLREAEYTPRQ